MLGSFCAAARHPPPAPSIGASTPNGATPPSFPRARTPEQVEQERNLVYVALTRCQSELVWLDGEG